ncbi:Uncharacterised protein [Halioglobus japonicus]|nr:Uncharacterised protein [Halioglobus japonicus]
MIDATARANGRDGSIGSNGRNGALGFVGFPGESGNSATVNGVTVRGGDGGDGGDGGRGGTGGRGGQGGGGAGGTIQLIGSIIDYNGDNVISANGGNGADDGRFLVQSNAESGAPSHSPSKKRKSSGPRDTNKIIKSLVETPLLPDLVGGPEVSGVFSLFDADDFPILSILSDKSDNALAAFTRVSDETDFFGVDFEGFDLLLLSNLSDSSLFDISLGADLDNVDDNFLTSLPIDFLTSMSIFVTLIPQGDTIFNLETSVGGFSGVSLMDRESTYLTGTASVPVPASMWLVVAALLGLSVLRKRHKAGC